MEPICAAITRAGHQVYARIDSTGELQALRADRNFDLVVLGAKLLRVEILSWLNALTRDCPLPVIVFTSDSDPEHIRSAIRAGVSAYIVDGFSPERVNPIIAVAVARFGELQVLRRELVKVQGKLSERKLIERAKGVLMKSRNLDEDEAYRALRKEAMARNLRLADVATQIIMVAGLLGAPASAAQGRGITSSKQI
jgi:response regulator NasT